jgi:hypothetical protein
MNVYSKRYFFTKMFGIKTNKTSTVTALAVKSGERNIKDNKLYEKISPLDNDLSFLKLNRKGIQAH